MKQMLYVGVLCLGVHALLFSCTKAYFHFLLWEIFRRKIDAQQSRSLLEEIELREEEKWQSEVVRAFLLMAIISAGAVLSAAVGIGLLF